MTETEAVLYLFRKNFSHCKEKKITLFGNAQIEELLVKSLDGYKFGLIENAQLVIVLQCGQPLIDNYRFLYKHYGHLKIMIYGLDGENLSESCADMLTEEDRYLASFNKNFFSLRSKRIVLYGKGPRTRCIIENLPEYSIIGLMDKTETEGEYCEKPILSYEEVIQRETDVIITISKANTTLCIYNRIHDFCKCNSISLYGENGDDLFERYGIPSDLLEEDPYFDICEDQLRREIDKHEVVSFSVFDTLLVSSAWMESDALTVIEMHAAEKGLFLPNYVSARKQADNIGHTKTLNDIYLEMQNVYEITDEEIALWIETETELRNQLLVVREKMRKIYNYARQCEKQLYLIADTVLPQLVLERILKEHKIQGYARIWVSNECHKSKRDGLFCELQREISGASWLHIGAGKYENELPLREMQADVFLIKAPLDMLAISSYAKIRTIMHTASERLLVGLFITRAFNDPFALYHSNGRIRLDSIGDIAYLFVAPMITKLVLWISRQMQKASYDDILFAARDGYLIKKLYTIYRQFRGLNIPKGKYFLTSRKAASDAGMQNEKDIERIFSLPYEKGPEQVLKDKYGFMEEDFPVYNEKQYGSLLDYAAAHKHFIFKASGKLRKNYLAYIKQEGLTENKRYAFFDLATSGTTQYYLENIVPFSLESLYLLWYDVGDEEKRKLGFNAMYRHNYIEKREDFISCIGEEYLRWNYAFLEPILTAPDPSVSGFDENGRPEYGKDSRTEEEIKLCVLAQKEIEDFFVNYIHMLCAENEDIDPQIPLQIYQYKDLKYTDECCGMLDDYVSRDDLGAGIFRIVRK